MDMKKFLFIFLVACSLTACREADSVIRVKTPARPAGQQDAIQLTAEPIDTVHIGIIGLGMRGIGAVKVLANIPTAKVVALCDLDSAKVERGQERLIKYGRPRAEGYWEDENAWKKLCERPDVDLVVVITDWEKHAMMAKYAMECGKHTAIEVPAAMNLEEIWSLVNTCERTRRHCMMLENCCYDFFELTTLNMAQHGLFGEIVHAEGAYIHDLDPFWDKFTENWRLRYNSTHKGDVYPTHGLGPVCQALNIHRGDRFKTLSAMETKPFSGPGKMKAVAGTDCPDFQNADLTMTMISTEKGRTILVEHDVMTPRPYSRMYQLVGTDGYASKYPVQQYAFRPEKLGPEAADIENLSAHKAVPDEVRDAMMEQYRSPILTPELEAMAKTVGGHGGMDFTMYYRLIYCLNHGLPLDMDVYDLAEWCCLAELGSISIAHGGAAVEVPDFTRGAWNKLNGYAHAKAPEDCVNHE